MAELNPRVYVACLASYNAGTLHGEWIDANQDVHDIESDIESMLELSPVTSYGEWAIHDHDGFHGISIGEHDTVETVAKHAAILDEYGIAWAAYVDLVGEHYATEEGFTDQYHGVAESETDFASELFGDIYNTEEIPEVFTMYFDYEKFARDLFITDYRSIEKDGELYIFRND